MSKTEGLQKDIIGRPVLERVGRCEWLIVLFCSAVNKKDSKEKKAAHKRKVKIWSNEATIATPARVKAPRRASRKFMDDTFERRQLNIEELKRVDRHYANIAANLPKIIQSNPSGGTKTFPAIQIAYSNNPQRRSTSGYHRLNGSIISARNGRLLKNRYKVNFTETVSPEEIILDENNSVAEPDGKPKELRTSLEWSKIPEEKKAA